MTIHGLTAYSLAITNSERQDIQNYFFECAESSKELFQKIDEVAKKHPNSKVFLRPHQFVERSL